jgi:hypothetical protein
VTDATVQAQRLTAGQKTVNGLTAAIAAADGKVRAQDVAFTYADAGFEGQAAVTVAPALQVEEVRVNFKGLDQAIVTAALYPDYFTAEGRISGGLVLQRSERGMLSGRVQIDTDGEGTVKFSRETVSQIFGPRVRYAMEQAGSLIPENVDEILMAQFTNFTYDRGQVTVQDGERGLEVLLNYHRRPLEPGELGYSVPVTVEGQTVQAKVEFGFGAKGFSVTLNNSIANLLKQMLGFQSLVLAVPAGHPAHPPETAPATDAEERP